jgi:hypothetical protein
MDHKEREEIKNLARKIPVWQVARKYGISVRKVIEIKEESKKRGRKNPQR